MRTSRLAVLVALGAVLPALVGSPAWAGGARSRTAPVPGQQQGELKGSDTVAQDGFGVSVAISGATVVAGAPGYAKSAGRAYVFAKTGAAWKQAAELKGSDTVAGDYFGYCVVISGTTIVAGSPGYAKDSGRVYVFTATAGGWQQAAELKGSDTAAGDYFGYSVAISGTTIGVGAPGHAKTAGRVYLFRKTGDYLETVRRTQGLRHRRGRCLRLCGGHLGHDGRRGCAGLHQEHGSGIRVHRHDDRLEAGRRAEGLRHRRRGRVRRLGGHLGHDRRGRCRRSCQRRRSGLRVHELGRWLEAGPPS